MGMPRDARAILPKGQHLCYRSKPTGYLGISCQAEATARERFVNWNVLQRTREAAGRLVWTNCKDDGRAGNRVGDVLAGAQITCTRVGTQVFLGDMRLLTECDIGRFPRLKWSLWLSENCVAELTRSAQAQL